MRRFHHWLARSSRAPARSRLSAAGSTGSYSSLMRRERRRELLPLSHQPHHLLLRPLALGGRLAHALAVRVEGRVAQPLAELGQPGLERVNLALDFPEPLSQLA